MNIIGKLAYEFILSGITITDNIFLGIFIMAIFDGVAYLIAYKLSNNRFDHWLSRIVLILSMSFVFIIVTNIMKFIFAYWLVLLVIIAIVLFLFLFFKKAINKE